MARSRYIGVNANYTHYSLVIEGKDSVETINDDWGDESGGEFKRCVCKICNEELTEHQYTSGKLVEYDEDPSGDLSYSLAHKSCVEKLKKKGDK